MGRFTSYFLLLLITITILSCSTNSRLIGENEITNGSIKFFKTNTNGHKSYISKVYADVNNNGIKKYYSFYPDRIIMTDERAKNISYKVIFHKLPDNYDTNIYRQFSKLDTLVFVQMRNLLETSKYSHLKKLEGALGYEIEVNYYHGFPKDKKFLPL